MRVAGLNPDQVQGDVARILKEQEEKLGTAVSSARIMARCPSILIGAKALGNGVEASGLISTALRALVNRRVASYNDCPF